LEDNLEFLVPERLVGHCLESAFELHGADHVCGFRQQALQFALKVIPSPLLIDRPNHSSIQPRRRIAEQAGKQPFNAKFARIAKTASQGAFGRGFGNFGNFGMAVFPN
jgi:hypothetical protein